MMHIGQEYTYLTILNRDGTCNRFSCGRGVVGNSSQQKRKEEEANLEKMDSRDSKKREGWWHSVLSSLSFNVKKPIPTESLRRLLVL